MRHCPGFELLLEVLKTEPACTAIGIYAYPHAGVGYECCEDANMVTESRWCHID
jgi:hypothetical protein